MTVPSGSTLGESSGGPQPDGQSPFGGGEPLPPSGDSTNPYAAPADYTASEDFGSTPPEERVRLPALLMIIANVLGILLQIGSTIYQVVMMTMMMKEQPQLPAEHLWLGVGMQLGLSCLGVVLRGIGLFGAIKMRKLESYAWAMTAAVIAVIPCFSACCLLEIPLGIWAIVVLSDNHVREAFRRRAPQ
jgi:hypothetical protein